MHSAILRRSLIFILAIFFVVIALIIVAKSMYMEYMQTELSLPSDFIQFNIEPGMNSSSIVKALVTEKIIDKPYFLKYAIHEKNLGVKLKAGEYKIENGITPEALLGLLQSHKVIQYRLTLIEGWSYSQMMDAIKDSEHLVKTLDNYSMDTVRDLLGVKEISLEGLFFPDTYHFPAGTTDVDFLTRSHDSLKLVLNEEWAKGQEGLPYKKPYEALIMASIVEKETGRAEERADIAGVFVKRLNVGMLLQTDPTVIYAIGQSFDGNIRKKDLSIDSPYNTYRYKGLPPGPISLVGREAIHAALNPAENEYFYFVAKGDGTHQFSKDLNEHNRAVRKYQLKK